MLPGLSPPSQRLEAAALGADELLLGTTGAALIYSRGSDGWTLTDRLTTDDPFDDGTTVPSGTFGSSVALSGDTALVGCAHCKPHGTDSGAVYVYVRSAGRWSLQQVLTAENRAPGDLLGMAVALDEDTALLTSAKGAHVFVRNDGTFSELTTLATPSPGTHVALKGNLAVVVCNSVHWDGTRADTSEMPSVPTGAFLFTRTGDAWSTARALPGTPMAAHAAVASNHALVTTWDRSSDFHYWNHDGSWLEFSSDGDLLQSHDSGSEIAVSAQGVLVSTSQLERIGDSQSKPTNRSPALLWGASQEVYDFAPLAPAEHEMPLDLLAMSDDRIAFGRWDGSVDVLARYAEPKLACSHDDDCLSRHCVSGICCDSACTGACQSCSAAEKGYGSDGVCDWIAAATQTRCGEPSCQLYYPDAEATFSAWTAMSYECRDRAGCVTEPELCGQTEDTCQRGACTTTGGENAGSGGSAQAGEAADSGGDGAVQPQQGGSSSQHQKKAAGGCNLPQRPATGGGAVALLLVGQLWWRRSRRRARTARA